MSALGVRGTDCQRELSAFKRSDGTSSPYGSGSITQTGQCMTSRKNAPDALLPFAKRNPRHGGQRQSIVAWVNHKPRIRFPANVFLKRKDAPRHRGVERCRKFHLDRNEFPPTLRMKSTSLPADVRQKYTSGSSPR